MKKKYIIWGIVGVVVAAAVYYFFLRKKNGGTVQTLPAVGSGTANNLVGTGGSYAPSTVSPGSIAQVPELSNPLPSVPVTPAASGGSTPTVTPNASVQNGGTLTKSSTSVTPAPTGSGSGPVPVGNAAGLTVVNNSGGLTAAVTGLQTAVNTKKVPNVFKGILP